MDSIHPEQCDLCFTLRYDTYCSKCSRHLCNACNHGHACKDEAGLIADAAKQKDSYKVNSRKNPCVIKYVCDEHNCEYNRFCGTCGDVICQDCCSNKHADHDIESIPTAWTKCAAIVRSLLTNLNHDIETAVKLVTDLHDIISETENRKQIQDVTDLIKKLETTLIDVVQEKQREEKKIVKEYISDLENCIKAWDKNRDKLGPVANEMNSVPFLLGFSDYVHDHENMNFPEAIETNFLPHDKILHYEEFVEKDVASLLEFLSSVTGVYAVSGVASREPSPGTVSASVNVSTSGTTRIHKLFTKHPQREEPRTKDICKDGQVSSNYWGYCYIVIKSLKQENINAIVEQKSLMFQFEQTMEEKESIRQRFIEMAGRTLSSIGSARSRDVEYDEQVMPKQIIEMFGKLYEEEWRQTLDKLSITGRWQAHIVIKHLFLVNQNCYKTCQRISDNQTKDLMSALFVDAEDSKRHTAEIKQVREFRKSTSTMCAVNLQKMIVEKPEFQANLLKWDQKDYDLLSEILNTPYFNRCVYLSWLMVVQNPPMYIDEGPVRRSYINRDVYHEFTKKGSIIDYCVWPALYVEKGGPLGTKGIVQVY
ncbi:Hypothetical predicted protein [Mytilus galloprovincialis]|uniref:B box-type domain-containing protein n=1 Tax=Mytilus galloprovincialis TaxID=29158 RepID=A0A8B6F045_MYTGA|nr:Hypothetical predicted protein [Mytilus galloprovincialis]